MKQALSSRSEMSPLVPLRVDQAARDRFGTFEQMVNHAEPRPCEPRRQVSDDFVVRCRGRYICSRQLGYTRGFISPGTVGALAYSVLRPRSGSGVVWWFLFWHGVSRRVEVKPRHASSQQLRVPEVAETGTGIPRQAGTTRLARLHLFHPILSVIGTTLLLSIFALYTSSEPDHNGKDRGSKSGPRTPPAPLPFWLQCVLCRGVCP